MVTTVLALDQAKTTGFSVFKNNKLFKYGIETFGNSSTTYENILYPAVTFIEQKINETQATLVVIEGIQYQSNMATFRKLAMLQGAIVCLFAKNNIPFDIVEPTKWKSYCQIKGRKRVEAKANTIKFVKDKFHIDVTEDEADAIGIGWYAVNNIHLEELCPAKKKKRQ